MTKYEIILWIFQAVHEAENTRELDDLDEALYRIKLAHTHGYLDKIEVYGILEFMEKKLGTLQIEER